VLQFENPKDSRSGENNSCRGKILNFPFSGDFFMTKTKPNAKKIETVEKLAEKLARAKAFFLADYRGLTHKQLEDLRKILKKADSEFTIVKNTLFKKTLEKEKVKDIQSFDKFLKDTTAALFAYGDQLSAIKALADFAKNFSLPKIKIGLMDNNLISKEDFTRLASIPSKEILLSTLIFRLKSPLYGLHYSLNWNLQKFVIALNNIKSKKPAN